MRRRRGVLVRIFRPTFSASPLTTLAGAGEKCGAENESSPRHFEHLCNASENVLPKTLTIPTSHSKPRSSLAGGDDDRQAHHGARHPLAQRAAVVASIASDATLYASSSGAGG